MPDRSPEITPRCLKCGSDAMIPSVRFLEVDGNGGRRPVEAAVQTQPDAALFKGEIRVPLTSRVCGDCGIVEVYASDPHKLWDAHIDRTARQLDR